MLRAVVVLLGAVMLLGGLPPLALDAPPIFALVMFGVLVLVGTLYERFRYKPLDENRPGAGWQATDERFIDDESGKPVTVYIKPSSGERRYVHE